MTTTCNHALYAIVDVFTQFFRAIPETLVDELYTHISWCVHQGKEEQLKIIIDTPRYF